MDANTESVYHQALNNQRTTDDETAYIPFSLRELITPQYRGGVTEDEGNWQNWVTQHSGDRTVYTPTDRRQLITSVLRKAKSKGKVRAVGSGHSHSNAPAPRTPTSISIRSIPRVPRTTASTMSSRTGCWILKSENIITG
jgi:hypothetical protein